MHLSRGEGCRACGPAFQWVRPPERRLRARLPAPQAGEDRQRRFGDVIVHPVAILFITLLAARVASAGAAADLAHAIAQAGLDSQQCYRVRGLTIAKEDLRLYFTNGYLMFG